MRTQDKTTLQRQNERKERMEKRYVLLWKKQIAPNIIIEKIADEFSLSTNRVYEILRPHKLRQRLNLK